MLKKPLSAFFFLIIYLIFNTHCTDKSVKKEKTGILADSGMVVSAHPLASKVGLEILRKGGTAIDAAISVQFALAVVYPGAGNIGGGGFMVIRKNSGEISSIDFREKAPVNGSRKMYQDENGEVISGLSTRGHLASGVPGTVAGMQEAWEKLGTLKWEELLQPAIDFALKGYPLTEREARSLNGNREVFEKYNTVMPENLLNNWEEGDTIFMKDLGQTLERIRDNKRDGFYAGKTAELIVEEMKRGGGIITASDLAQYNAQWRDPVTTWYKNHKIISMAPPSSGGVALIQLLKMTQDYPIARWGWNSTKTIHLMAEAEKRVYADRAFYLGDPDFLEVPVDKLTDSNYLVDRMSTFQMDRVTPSDSISEGKLNYHESTETTHFSIVDKYGNAVAVTTTLNGGFGSKVVVGGAGFFLNNEMDDFSIKPGYPNMFGLLGGEANAINPQKRMLSSMTPTIVTKGEDLFMVVGTPGGATIITSVYQTILNVIEHEMTMQEAVEAKRFHHQWKPEQITLEKNAIDSVTETQLQEKGHILNYRNAIGRVDAILVRDDGKFEGGADPRGDDYAAGY